MFRVQNRNFSSTTQLNLRVKRKTTIFEVLICPDSGPQEWPEYWGLGGHEEWDNSQPGGTGQWRSVNSSVNQVKQVSEEGGTV